MNPGQVKPNLQVAEVFVVVSAEGFLCRVSAQSAALKQLQIARERLDHLIEAAHEEVVEQEKRLFAAEAVGGALRETSKWRSLAPRSV